MFHKRLVATGRDLFENNLEVGRDRSQEVANNLEVGRNWSQKVANNLEVGRDRSQKVANNLEVGRDRSQKVANNLQVGRDQSQEVASWSRPTSCRTGYQTLRSDETSALMIYIMKNRRAMASRFESGGEGGMATNPLILRN